MTTDPQGAPGPDFPGRVDIEAVFKDVPPIGDISELAAPEIFETDEELDEFLEWYRAERDAHAA